MLHLRKTNRMKTIFSLFLLLFSLNAIAMEEPVAFRIFDGKGKKTTFEKAAKTLLTKDVVFFGELHNNAIAHWLQLRLTQAAFELKKEQLVLSAEMFEADNQQGMNDYLSGKIADSTFRKTVRLWPNYDTDYLPLVEFAKEHQLRFVCANVPRKLANLVYKFGTDTLTKLSAEQKSWMAPVPFVYNGELGCYKRMKEMMGGHGGDNLPKAQAIKDATMAWFIKENVGKGQQCIHFNGSWHSEYGEGVQWYLQQYAPQLTRSSITTVLQKDLNALEKENLNKSDFIIVVPEDMTNTH